MGASGAGSASLKEYLKRYESYVEDDKKDKKKKKKVKKKQGETKSGVLVVDEDPIWQKPVQLEEEDNDSPDEEKPVVDEDIEVKRMKRLELLRAKRAHNAIAEDGSGWVTLSPKHKPSNDEIDLSPPRRRRDYSEGAASPSSGCPRPRRRQPPTKGSDLSPLRKSNRNSMNDSEDLSPPRKSNRHSRNDSDDLSPPRKSMKYATNDLEDLSPPRRSNRNSRNDSEDLSLPRRGNRNSRNDSKDLSPPRRSDRHSRHDSEDLSPPRRSNRTSRNDSEDLSPHRNRNKQNRNDTEEVSPRRSNNHLRNDSKDVSRPRKHRPVTNAESSRDDISPTRRSRMEPNVATKQAKTGLISGREMRDEILRTKMDDLSRFELMDPSISGRGAEPVYRDKKGNRISKDEFVKLNSKVEEKPKEKKIEWGKGLAQKREAEAKVLELEREKEKPFARTRDDPELDDMLKERVRWGDPMAHLVKKKRPDQMLPDLGENSKMKESGFIIPQDIPAHSWIKRGIDAAPNRYGIKPGRHWDGVDRSTGFEKQFFKRMNEKRADVSEAYLWSVADM